MRKVADEGRDMPLALLAYRNTPVSDLEYSTAQLLMSRMLNDRPPIATSLLSPKVAQGVHRSLLARQQRQKRYRDQGTKALPPLQIGVHVTVQRECTWSPAIVVEKYAAPRSFKVMIEDGQILQSMEAEPTQADQVVLPPTPAEDKVAYRVTHASLSTSPEKVPSETTSPVGLPVSTPLAPRRRVSERQIRKPKWLNEYEHKLSGTTVCPKVELKYFVFLDRNVIYCCDH